MKERIIFLAELASLGIYEFTEPFELSRDYFKPKDAVEKGKSDDHIHPQALRYFRSPKETEFKKQVYEIQRRNAINKKIKFVPSIPERDLGIVYGRKNIKLRLLKDAATKCNELIDAAIRYLEEEKSRNPNKTYKIEFWVQSGYRDVEHELELWEKYFPQYYDDTITARKNQIGGEFGFAAAKWLARYISPKKAVPGYGKHSRGQAVDFRTDENGFEFKLSTKPENVQAWKNTWFYNWLLGSAYLFRFKLNPRINEPWHWEYQPLESSQKEYFAPSLPTGSLLGETIYPEINLRIGRVPGRDGKLYLTKPRTGIHIPPKFNKETKVNFIVYLHGHKFLWPPAPTSIDFYWEISNYPFFALREVLEQSEKNAILIAPTLGPKSQTGILLHRGIDWYLQMVMEVLKKKGISKDIGEIVLSCHSGGGYPMARLAIHNTSAKIIECWGFDCLYEGKYNPSKLWLDWASRNKDKNLYFFQATNPTLNETRKLESGAKTRKLPNIHIEYSKVEPIRVEIYGNNPTRKKRVEIPKHFLVTIAHMGERLANLNWN